MKPIITVLLVVVLATSTLVAQTTKSPIQRILSEKIEPRHYFSAQWLGLTYHFNISSNPSRYIRRLDANAVWVWSPGIALNYDIQTRERLFWRASASYYKDCADLHGGYMHLGYRYKYLSINKKHHFNIGIGPTFIFRQDWNRFEEYNGNFFYDKNVSHGFQYRLVLYGGEVEYLGNITQKMQLQLSLVPAYPSAFVAKIGFRFKLDEKTRPLFAHK